MGSGKNYFALSTSFICHSGRNSAGVCHSGSAGTGPLDGRTVGYGFINDRTICMYRQRSCGFYSSRGIYKCFVGIFSIGYRQRSHQLCAAGAAGAGTLASSCSGINKIVHPGGSAARSTRTAAAEPGNNTGQAGTSPGVGTSIIGFGRRAGQQTVHFIYQAAKCE